MRKLLLILGIILFTQIHDISAQSIELPFKFYLCENESVNLDGTVLNTSDSGITYQWYYNEDQSVFLVPANLLVGATSPILNITDSDNVGGFYKILATLTDGTEIIDETRLINKDDIYDSEFVPCNTFSIEQLSSYDFLFNTSNITTRYYELEDDAILGNNNNMDFFQYAFPIYLRIDENNGLCAEIIPILIYPEFISYYAFSVPDMGSCSPDSSIGVFDLTINDDQIINGQFDAVVSYFINYDDAYLLVNPIVNATNYIALSPNQTIYARVYDPIQPNTFCDDVYDSITLFSLLSVTNPTPNTEVDYIVCDNSSGSDSDGVGAFDLTSRNTLVLSGLNTFQYNISYYTTLVDAESNANPITSPNNYIAGNEFVFVRVESSASPDCVRISQLNLIVQDACDDISVNLVSYWQAPRPGFTYRNMLIVKNNGESTVSSGTVEFTNDALATYTGTTGLSAGNTITPTANGFTLDFIDLLPGESEVIYIQLLVPASANLGDIITNTAEYTTATNDVVLENNTSTLSEIIIGSYDPNDINESHGPEIVHPSFTEDDYLYYTIRFQNVGTASAINVTIDNNLDEKLDKTTFQMLRASHSYGIERDFDKLTWQFSNINLPDDTTDEPNSHGFVYYKIKPSTGYSIGDIIPNTASIVFDFNAPIVTNTFNTEFIDTLGIQDTSLNGQFLLTPNPSKDVVNLKFNSVQSTVEISIFDILGKTVLTHKAEQTSIIPINISSIENGIYFVKIKDQNGQSGLKKLIKE